jgi:hypothetical protein
MKARTALIALFKESQEWRYLFKSCCETSTLRLSAQSWQFHDDLRDRGHRFSADEVEDALLRLAREVLPYSPAAQWDTEWAHKLCKYALSRLAEYYARLAVEERDALDLSGQDVWDQRMHTAGLAKDPAAFRTALKGWERAGLEALSRARVKGGAA